VIVDGAHEAAAIERICEQLARRRASAGDNAVTTYALSTESISSKLWNEMGVSPWCGRKKHAGGKVEGLVLRKRGGSSSLPGRTEKPC
jgi:hypothetical protein